MSQRPFVSVIIPVLNSFQSLKNCLNALENQTYPKDLFEVIVVDNGSTENVRELFGQLGHVVVTFESTPTSYAARNKGVSIAKGEVLAFTDSDCIPAVDWIERGVENLQKKPNCGLVAGKVEMFFKVEGRPNIVELYDSLTFLQQRTFIEKGHFGATANLFTFKKIFVEIGPFNAELTSSGDVEWGNRVFKKGYEQVYADDTLVKHIALDTLLKLRRKVIRIVGGHFVVYRQKDATGGQFFGKFIQDVWRHLKTAVGVFQDKRLKGPKQKIGFFFTHFYAKCVGACERLRLRAGGKPMRR